MPRTRQEQFDALTTAISRVITPVMICMALAVWFVHSLGDPEDCRRLSKSRTGSVIGLTPASGTSESSGSSTTYTPLLAGIFIAIFVVLLVVFTFLLVWLYKTGRTKYIIGWLMIAVFLIFAYVGGLYIFDFCRSRCMNLDWITLVIAVWNFTITGLFAVFGVVPRIVNQAYLIVMSALMAYIFRALPSWSIWVILGLLVVWDLYAVLAPHGPLKMLVEAARDKGDPLPALVYDTNPHDVGRDESAQPSVVLPNKSKKTRRSNREENTADTIAPESADPETANGEIPSTGSTPTGPPPRFKRSRRKKPATSSSEPDAAQPPATADTTAPANAAATREQNETEEIRVGTLGAHLKLGLGDFVFYSILVAQASQSGAMTTIASYVAILAGLCATLFLVTVYKKALPALPISITVGLIFYFLTRYTVQPFITNLLPELLFY